MHLGITPPVDFYITLLLRPQVFLIDSVANNEKRMKYTDAHVLFHECFLVFSVPCHACV